MAASLYDFSALTIDGRETRLAEYAGKVLLIVNTASECGFTPQYAGLESLYRKYAEQGLVVLGFPCNQFGTQEPGNEAQIAAFCSTRFQVSFPMFAKVDVNGPTAHPLFRFLKEHAKGVLGSEGIKWNFTKFLVGRDGRVIDRYAPMTKPEDIARDIEPLL
ncbi:glutathione peroxidase [Uliginosibacterium sp. sgz301328]|uniref:glutathione peroxidase n=1 Tax=Uliginosibacterium sp. sgz301328 TaxID=3243764 RepID=UPI00359CC9BE